MLITFKQMDTTSIAKNSVNLNLLAGVMDFAPAPQIIYACPINTGKKHEKKDH